MQSTSLKVLRVLMWCVCAFHLIVGLGLNLWPGFPQLMATYYGAHADWTPQFVYILKPLGVFMIALGLIAMSAARDPLAHAPVIYAFAVIFIGRSLHRLLLWPVLRDTFEIPAANNFASAVFFALLAIVLLTLHRVASHGTVRKAAVAT